MSTTMAGSNKNKRLSSILINGVLALICLIWTIPTIGLLVSSFRTRDDIQTSGWWTILPHREWVHTEEFKPDPSLDRDGVMEISGVTGTFQEFRDGIQTPDGKRIIWIGNKRNGTIYVEEREWTMPSAALRSASSDRSSPAQKCSPSPLSTTARVASGRLTKAVCSSATKASLMALRLAGRLRRMWVTASRCSTRSKSGDASAGVAGERGWVMSEAEFSY